MDQALLDTDIFSEVLKRKNQNVVQNATAYRQHFGHYTISVITVTEMINGFQKRGREDRITALITALATEEVLPLDRDASVIAGRIYGELERAGQPIGRADPLIAAIAIQHSLKLVTGNVKHFERIVAVGFTFAIEDWRL
jgi:tRNA(fMet)-specific endonuclease VapC